MLKNTLSYVHSMYVDALQYTGDPFVQLVLWVVVGGLALWMLRHWKWMPSSAFVSNVKEKLKKTAKKYPISLGAVLLVLVSGVLSWVFPNFVALIIALAGLVTLTLVIRKLKNEMRTAVDTDQRRHTALSRKKHFEDQKSGRLRSEETLLLGGAMSVTLGSFFVFLLSLTLKVPDGKELLIYPALLFVSSYGLFVPGLTDVGTNYVAMPAWAKFRRIKWFEVSEGFAWFPWFLGFGPYQGETPDKERGGSKGQVYVGNRRLSRKDTSSDDNTSPSVPARDQIETRIPFSAVIETVHAYNWQQTEMPVDVIKNKVLETLRLAASKFHFNDLLTMKSLIANLVQGEHYVLVARIKKKKSDGEPLLKEDEKHLAQRVMIDAYGNRLFETVNVRDAVDVIEMDDGTEIVKETGIEHAKMKLLERVDLRAGHLVERDDRGVAVINKDDIEVIYVADGLINEMKRVGAYISSAQIIDVTPEDKKIFEAAAAVEMELRQRRGEMIQAETNVLVVNRLAAEFDMEKAVAAELARIFSEKSREVFIRGESSGFDRVTGALLLNQQQQ